MEAVGIVKARRTSNAPRKCRLGGHQGANELYPRPMRRTMPGIVNYPRLPGDRRETDDQNDFVWMAENASVSSGMDKRYEFQSRAE